MRYPDDQQGTRATRFDDLRGGHLSRREVMRRAAALGLAGAGGLGAGLATAPAFRASAEEGKGGVVNVADTFGDHGIGNPILVNGTTTYVFWWAFSRLVKYDDRGSAVPDLADTWEWAADGTRITFTLNPAATWHDRTPVTSADVLFTFDKIKDETTQTSQASRLQVGGEWVRWSAPDPHTVVVEMPSPYAPFLFALSQIGVIPRHVLEGSPDINTDPFNLAPIGSGPWKVVDWQVDQFIKFEPHEAYHRGRPAADNLNVVWFADAQPALAALEAGEVDFVFTPPESQAQYEGRDDFVLYRYVYFTPISLSFNFKHPTLQDVRVRQAIRAAIDKDTLAEIVTKGRNRRADNQYADGGPLDRYNDYSLPKDVYDVEQAKALLDEAGWVMNGDYREKDGERLSLPMLTYAGFEEYKNDLEILQQMLKEVGIEVQTSIIEYDALYSRWADPDDDPMTRALTVEEYPHPFEMDPDIYDELHSANLPPAGFNYNAVQDEQIDALINEGRATVDDEQRIAIYRRLDARRKEVIPSVPLYLATDGWVANAGVGGVPADTPNIRWFLRCYPEMLFKNE